MLNKFKKYIDKLNALLDNGLIIKSISNNEINISDKYIICCDLYDNYLYFHRVNELTNHGFMFYDVLNFKTLKIFIDNLMYDLNNGIIAP